MSLKNTIEIFIYFNFHPRIKFISFLPEKQLRQPAHCPIHMFKFQSAKKNNKLHSGLSQVAMLLLHLLKTSATRRDTFLIIFWMTIKMCLKFIINVFMNIRVKKLMKF